ncbi:MAG: flagellar hook-basal body complex protein FliE [Rhodothermales bacterium]|nr:flagellar hook-basal body complex protein FliE [Rhodothermales bacterium]
MSIGELQRLRGPLGPDTGLSLPRPRETGVGNPGEFGDMLKNAIDRVDDVQKHADGEITSWVAGEQENLHEVMISMNHAQLSFQLMTEVRNRLLDTYQELMRMQV